MTTTKLSGLGPVYYINLDTCTERRRYVEDHFREHGIRSFQRVPAFDGRQTDPRSVLEGGFPPKVDRLEAACTISHLTAIREFAEHASAEHTYAVICEDDVDLGLAAYWPFDWDYVMANLPYDWDCVQLSLITSGSVEVTLHPHSINEWSAACYLISRHHAQKLCRLHTAGDRFRLDNGVRPRAAAEYVVFGSGKTYSAALFSYLVDMGSTIHQEHVDRCHRPSRQAVHDWWRTHAHELEPAQFFAFDVHAL